MKVDIINNQPPEGKTIESPLQVVPTYRALTANEVVMLREAWCGVSYVLDATAAPSEYKKLVKAKDYYSNERLEVETGYNLNAPSVHLERISTAYSWLWRLINHVFPKEGKIALQRAGLQSPDNVSLTNVVYATSLLWRYLGSYEPDVTMPGPVAYLVLQRERNGAAQIFNDTKGGRNSSQVTAAVTRLLPWDDEGVHASGMFGFRASFIEGCFRAHGVNAKAFSYTDMISGIYGLLPIMPWSFQCLLLRFAASPSPLVLRRQRDASLARILVEADNESNFKLESHLTNQHTGARALASNYYANNWNLSRGHLLSDKSWPNITSLSDVTRAKALSLFAPGMQLQVPGAAVGAKHKLNLGYFLQLPPSYFGAKTMTDQEMAAAFFRISNNFSEEIEREVTNAFTCWGSVPKRIPNKATGKGTRPITYGNIVNDADPIPDVANLRKVSPSLPLDDLGHQIELSPDPGYESTSIDVDYDVTIDELEMASLLNDEDFTLL